MNHSLERSVEYMTCVYT